jgi:hypothetical protein
MRIGTKCLRGFKVLAVVLTCLVVQAIFTLPAHGDEIVGWGRNNIGQATPPAGTDFVAVAANGLYGLALKCDGSIVGWGNNDYGQATPPAGNDYIAIAAGFRHGIALKSDGSLIGWGDNLYGRATPPAGNDFTAIAASSLHNLALKTDGSIVGWGKNEWGAVTPPSGNDFTAVAAGYRHSLALKSDGSIVGWGNNSYGQMTPPAGNDFTAIAAGGVHSLALKSDGSIVSWGSNIFHQATPPPGNDFIAIAAGENYSLALKTDGSIVGWGDNNFGRANPPAGNDFTGVAAGVLHGLALVSHNSPPVAHAGGPYLVPVGQSIVLDASNSVDPDGDGLGYAWSLIDPVDPPLGEIDGSTFAASDQAGVTYITLEVHDGTDTDWDIAMVVVYDPSAGFVTGGGWIHSMEGAYRLDESLTGGAYFGFVSRYKKGAKVPTGNTEFVFHAADMNFHSSSYQWLVVNQGGAKAQFKGTGTINGYGPLNFMLWAGDGGKNDYDTFRIKIWEEDEATGAETVIYDNGKDQPIGGGSIVIHTK